MTTSDVVHFLNGATRRTPCEREYLRGARVTLATKEVNCPKCLEDPDYLRLCALVLECTLAGPISLADVGTGLFGDPRK